MMSVAIKKAKLYLKLVLVVGVVVLSSVVLCNNRNNRTDVWFFANYQGVNVLKLMLATSVFSIFSFWILCTMFGMWRDWRELSAEQTRQDREAKLATRSQELDERERKLNEESGHSPPGV